MHLQRPRRAELRQLWIHHAFRRFRYQDRIAARHRELFDRYPLHQIPAIAILRRLLARNLKLLLMLIRRIIRNILHRPFRNRKLRPRALRRNCPAHEHHQNDGGWTDPNTTTHDMGAPSPQTAPAIHHSILCAFASLRLCVKSVFHSCFTSRPRNPFPAFAILHPPSPRIIRSHADCSATTFSQKILAPSKLNPPLLPRLAAPGVLAVRLAASHRSLRHRLRLIRPIRDRVRTSTPARCFITRQVHNGVHPPCNKLSSQPNTRLRQQTLHHRHLASLVLLQKINLQLLRPPRRRHRNPFRHPPHLDPLSPQHHHPQPIPDMKPLRLLLQPDEHRRIRQNPIHIAQKKFHPRQPRPFNSS